MAPSKSGKARNLSCRWLNKPLIRKAARVSGFVKRSPRKIDPENFVHVLCKEAVHRSPSFNDMAARLQADKGIHASRQAFANRISPSCHHFLQILLEQTMAAKITAAAGDRPMHGFRGYRRVMVQDSTVIQLPAALFPLFSGVANAHRAVCNARIQVACDLTAMRFTAFSIDPYSKNDQSAAPELEIREGDLVLRDRGYLLPREIQRHVDAGADCIYRHKTGTVYLNARTRRPIDLLALLRRHGRLDLPVLLNNASRTLVRLVAMRVDQPTAELRRMRAKKEMRGHAPSTRVLALMDWTIFITTIRDPQVSFEAILALYGLRWRIEMIFKSWKSHLKFGVVHQVSATQLHILLKARLLVITACAMLYGPCHAMIRKKHGRNLSLLKFTGYLAANPGKMDLIVRELSGRCGQAGASEALARYCCYDKRRKRMNFQDIWESLALT